MKKLTRFITLFLVLSVMVMPMLTTISAKSNEKVEKEKNTKENVWSYKGIKFTVVTDHELTNEDKKEFEKDFELKNSKKDNFDVTTNYIPVDGDGQTVGGPVYRTFDNTIEKDVVLSSINAAGTYVATKLGSVKWASIAAFTATYFTQKMDAAIPYYTYWGFWQTKSYSSYYGYYEFYNTDVRYQNSNYTGAMEVYYYNTSYHE